MCMLIAEVSSLIRCYQRVDTVIAYLGLSLLVCLLRMIVVSVYHSDKK